MLDTAKASALARKAAGLLTAARADALTVAITSAFATIGKSDATRMPRSGRAPSANAELAWELFVAKLLNRIATTRLNAVLKKAVRAGIMFDAERAPMSVGTNAVVWASDLVEVSVLVTTPTTRFDVDGFAAALVASGVKPSLVKRLREEHTLDNRAPHTFSASLVAA